MVDVKILFVYKNSADQQVGAKILRMDTDTQMAVALHDLIESCRNKECNTVNFEIVDGRYVRGKDCNLEFRYILSWQEIDKKYKGLYVRVQDSMYVNGNYHGVVVETCTESEIDKKIEDNILKKGNTEVWRYTDMPMFNVGVF